MKLFTALIDYPDDVLERRAPHRAAHLAYMEDLRQNHRALMGGAFADPVDGAIIVYRAETVEEVRQIMREDPYGKAGLFDQVRIREWTVVVGHPDEQAV
ncbi:YciI-like protein [soil metagenome]